MGQQFYIRAVQEAGILQHICVHRFADDTEVLRLAPLPAETAAQATERVHRQYSGVVASTRPQRRRQAHGKAAYRALMQLVAANDACTCPDNPDGTCQGCQAIWARLHFDL